MRFSDQSAWDDRVKARAKVCERHPHLASFVFKVSQCSVNVGMWELAKTKLGRI